MRASGDNVPDLALNPPQDKTVLLVVDPNAPALAETSSQQPVKEELILSKDGSKLPEEALTPPIDAIIKLKAMVVSGETDSVTVMETRSQHVIEFPYSGGPLPEQALKPPPGTVVKLRAPSDTTD